MTVQQTLTAIASLLEQEPETLVAERLPAVRELLADGFLEIA